MAHRVRSPPSQTPVPHARRASRRSRTIPDDPKAIPGDPRLLFAGWWLTGRIGTDAFFSYTIILLFFPCSYFILFTFFAEFFSLPSPFLLPFSHRTVIALVSTTLSRPPLPALPDYSRNSCRLTKRILPISSPASGDVCGLSCQLAILSSVTYNSLAVLSISLLARSAV